jgi:hypothetical protein
MPDSRPDLATVLWSAVASALALSCIRTHGQAEAAALVFAAESRRHERLLATATPSGSTALWRCAMVHVDLETREGLRPEVIEDAGRVWLRYRAPHWSGHGVTGPPATPAALGPAIGRAHYSARHGLTAEVVGGPGVIFVHTHDLTDGDAFDAGYFATVAGDGAEEHYVRSRGVKPPAFAGAENRPQPRDSQSVTPWAASAAWHMVVVTERLGVVGGAAVIEHAVRTVLTACWPWLPGALGLDPIVTPTDAARLYASVARLLGDDVEELAAGESVLVRSTTDHFWDGHEMVPGAIRDATVRAWSASLTHHNWYLNARRVPPQPGDDTEVTVLFDRSGPGD